MWGARAMMFKHGVLSRLFWELWCLGRSSILFSTACMSWHIFNAYPPAPVAVAGACASFTCRWLLNMYLPCTRERGQKVRRRKVGVISSSTWFATDGYCLEFQGRDLMLCSPSISCRLWINQMKHKLLYCKYSPIRLQATANVNWNHITSATGRDTCDYSCSRELFGRLIFYTWRDFCKHLASSVCDRGRLPPLSFYFVYFAANQSGYPVGVCCLSSASVIPANQHRWCSEGASRRSFC